MTPRVSIIIVNYNSAHFIRRCIDTIGFDDSEIIIIDNASRKSDVGALKSLSRGGVKIIFNERNEGFAKGCNQGIESARGEYLLFLNPDTIIFGDALERLLECFQARIETAAVGPRIWWDTARTLQLPPSFLPSPSFDLLFSSMKIPLLGALPSRRAMKRHYTYWHTEHPLSVSMLSGAAILTSRDIIEKVGTFDESFSLYFEDSDWCRRALRSGYRLFMCPEAEICHFYNQSAQHPHSGSSDIFNSSRVYYASKHFHPLLKKAAESIGAVIRRLEMKAPGETIAMGSRNLPPSFSVKNRSRRGFLFQFSINDDFLPAAGMIFDLPEYTLSEEIWRHLSGGHYFARFVEMESWKVSAAWSFTKKE
jgi:GT2 family glycosyltransferase